MTEEIRKEIAVIEERIKNEVDPDNVEYFTGIRDRLTRIANEIDKGLPDSEYNFPMPEQYAEGMEAALHWASWELDLNERDAHRIEVNLELVRAGRDIEDLS